eukprot:TRINITY_DN2957_c0_g1_i1.p1 TRINITY_DN2957_c0_g1~~TRINITY_DN2957_c0_g1_i1.p1  ORF type:complete len:632 (+),score=167.30 TRINITY_DN2957_c0_g1_i1:297-2192(+)
MTLLGAAIMDTERIIPPTNGSPGSGGSGGLTHPSSSGINNAATNSLARKKKTERPAPNYGGMVHGSYVGMVSPGGAPPPSGNSPQYTNQGVTNLAYTRDAHNNSFLSHTPQPSFTQPPPPLSHQLGSYPSMSSSNTPSGVKLNMTTETMASMPEDSDEHQEVIEVQILPQDENWGETTTAVTHPSEMDYPGEKELEKWQLGNESSLSFRLRRQAGAIAALFLSSISILSPILMALLPKLGLFQLKEHQLLCHIECDGLLVAMSFKLLALILGTWGVFYRRSRSSLPRIRVYRALISSLVLLFVVTFWLFYSAHLIQEDETLQYGSLVRFAMHLVDSLLFVHYAAVILMELRHRQSAYFLKVVRSPDGESHCYPIGQLSVQRAASWVLEKYYTDFSIYNPYLDRLLTGGSTRFGKKGVKIYDLDGAGNNTDCNSTVVSVASKKGYSASHNERFHEEYEHEKKLRKRKTRLITATEEAFTHIKRIKSNQRGSEKTPMESVEAAQAIFPTISRPLQKYLRVTRQQPIHTMQSILDHLSTCLSYDMSPRSFLERYLVTNPVLQNQYESKDVQSWALISDRLLYRDISAGTTFQLRQGDISLLCQIQNLPHFHISEEIIDSSSNRFVLRLNSETSV